MKSFTELNKDYQDYTNNETPNNVSRGKTGINDAQRVIIQKYFSNETVFSFKSQPNKSIYSLPADVSKLTNVTVWIGTFKYQPDIILTPERWDEITAVRYNSDIPVAVFIYQGKLEIYPVPSSENTVNIRYKRSVPQMSYEDYNTGYVSNAIYGSYKLKGSTQNLWQNNLPINRDIWNLNLYLALTRTTELDTYPISNWYKITQINVGKRSIYFKRLFYLPLGFSIDTTIPNISFYNISLSEGLVLTGPGKVYNNTIFSNSGNFSFEVSASFGSSSDKILLDNLATLSINNSGNIQVSYINNLGVLITFETPLKGKVTINITRSSDTDNFTINVISSSGSTKVSFQSATSTINSLILQSSVSLSIEYIKIVSNSIVEIDLDSEITEDLGLTADEVFNYKIGQMPVLEEDFQQLLVYKPTLLYLSNKVDSKDRFAQFSALYADGISSLEQYLGAKFTNQVDLDVEIDQDNPNNYLQSINPIIP